MVAPVEAHVRSFGDDDRRALAALRLGLVQQVAPDCDPPVVLASERLSSRFLNAESTIVVTDQVGAITAGAALAIGTEPYLARREGVLALLHASQHCDPEYLRVMLDQHIARARSAGCHAIYGEALDSDRVVNDTLALLDWQPYLFVLRKGLSGGHAAPVSCRPARVSDHDWIADCLDRAFSDGLPKSESLPVARRGIEREITAMITPIDGDDKLILVSEVNEVRHGFCFVQLGELDPYTNQREAQLVNSFIEPQFRSRGLSTRLTGMAEVECHRRGYTHISGHVVAYASPATVVPALVGSGWSRFLTVYRREIAG